MGFGYYLWEYIPSTTSQGPWELKYRPKMEGSEVHTVPPKSKLQDPNPQNQNSKIQNQNSKIQKQNSKIQNQNSKIQNQNSKIQNQNSKIQTPTIKTPKSKIKTPRSKPPESKFQNQNSKVKTYINFWFMTGPPKKNDKYFFANYQHNEQNIKMEITKKNLAIDFFPSNPWDWENEWEKMRERFP